MPRDFATVSIQGNDDRLHTDDFFLDIINKYPVLKNEQKVKIITVNHILSTTPYFLKALGKVGEIVAIIPKGSYKDADIMQGLRAQYSDLIDEITKEYLQNPVNARNYILSKVKAGDHCIILDIGGYFAPGLQEFNQSESIRARLLGIIEDTENGHQKYAQALQQCPNNHFSIYSSARIELKEVEDHNVGKSIVHAADTLLRTAAKTIVERFQCVIVLGFGKIGASMAEHLKQKGMQVVIYDTDQIRLGKARSKGYSVIPDAHARQHWLAKADLIFCGTGNKALGDQDWAHLKDNVFIASCTSKDDELDTVYLERNALLRTVEHVTQCTLSTQPPKIINLFAGGNAVNFVFGAVNGPYVYNVQASIIAGAHELLKEQNIDKNKIHEISRSIQSEIMNYWIKNFEPNAVITDPLIRPINSEEDIRQIFSHALPAGERNQELPSIMQTIEATQGGVIEVGSSSTARVVNETNTAYNPQTLGSYQQISTTLKATGSGSQVKITGNVTTADIIHRAGPQ